MRVIVLNGRSASPSLDGMASLPERVSAGSSGSRRSFLKRVTAAGSVILLGHSPLRLAAAEAPAGLVRIRPKECPDAFANPLKGFRPDLPSQGGTGLGLDNPLATLARHYIRWNEIEASANDGVDKIREFCGPRWAGIERRNLKIIPRVYLYWPEQYYWPADLRAGDYGSRRFLHRLGRFIAKLGEAWNGDPRVACVETGIVGPCGEQWGPTPHAELKQVLAESYRAAFPDKLCLIRYPWQWVEYPFGVFWDSWGTHKDTARMLQALESPELAGSWKTAVRGGEISYGFGEPPGDTPDDTMTKSHHIDWIECLVRRGHWNHLGWVSFYDWRRPVAARNGQRLQRAFGYRFVLDEVSYPALVQPGQSLEIAFTVRNTGSTPFYYRWPVMACLLDEQTHECVWEEEFPAADVRQWLPGDQWQQFAAWDKELSRFVLDSQPARYRIPPQTYTVTGRFRLPASLPPARYILGLAILDPASRTPACRFAVSNYFAGGRHPIGRIGIGRALGAAELDPASFRDLAGDQSIGYRIPNRS